MKIKNLLFGAFSMFGFVLTSCAYGETDLLKSL